MESSGDFIVVKTTVMLWDTATYSLQSMPRLKYEAFRKTEHIPMWDGISREVVDEA